MQLYTWHNVKTAWVVMCMYTIHYTGKPPSPTTRRLAPASSTYRLSEATTSDSQEPDRSTMHYDFRT